MATTPKARFSVAFALLGMLVISPAVWAHAHLKSQQPAANSIVTAATQQLTLTFTENIESAFSGVEVIDAAQQSVVLRQTVVAPETRNQMDVTLVQPLAPGSYQVNWHVLSVDGHKLKGSYTFKVQ